MERGGGVMILGRLLLLSRIVIEEKALCLLFKKMEKSTEFNFYPAFSYDAQGCLHKLNRFPQTHTKI